MTDSENDIERGVYQTPSNDDDLYDDYDDEEGFGRGPVFAIFAVIVLAAFFGVIWLAYQQGLSQGRQSAPPIISASADPFKIEPVDPGGMVEPEQTATDDAISGTPREQVADVVASSEAPIEVAQNDIPEVQMATNDVTMDTPELRTSNNNQVGASGGVVVPRPSSRVQGAEAEADLRQDTAQPARTDVTPTRQDPAPAREQVQVETPPVQTRPAQTPPATRAQDRTPDPEPVVQDASIGPQLTQSTAAPANTGNFVVQVASFPEIPDADAAWARLQSRHAAIVAGHVQDIQAVDLGARGTWYRLRIGYFETRSAAVSLCEQLQANRQDCLVASR